MDELGIDKHKLVYHVSRVKDWLDGKNVYPVYVEIGPTSACNHRCIFCALDFTSYKGKFIDKDILMAALADMAKNGVKSIMFGGEGEPLLHKDIISFILHAKKKGLDVAITTNGALFNKEKAAKCVPALSWIKFSVDAGTAGNYSKIHGTKPEDFDNVMGNIREAAKIRNEGKHPCVIGVQMILLEENADDAVKLASAAKKAGADYFVVKPYSQHPDSVNKIRIDYGRFEAVGKKVESLSSGNFDAVYREKTIKKLGRRAPYQRCLGLPFFALVDAEGNVIPCNIFYGKKDYYYGNLYKNSFAQIWEGEQRKKVLEKISKRGVESCRENCRLDEINRYLWELKNPPLHINFI